MKTKLIYIGLILLMNSCLAVRAPQVYLGMSESEFRDKAKYEEIVEMTGDVTIYRVTYGAMGQEVRFYYFRNNKLINIDEGVRKTDARIRIDSNK